MYVSTPLILVILALAVIIGWFLVRWAKEAAISELLRPVRLDNPPEEVKGDPKPPKYCHGRAYFFKELRFVIVRCKGDCPGEAKCNPPVIFVGKLKKGEKAACKCGDKDVDQCSLVVTKEDGDNISFSCSQEKCGDNKACKVRRKDLDDELELIYCACDE